MNTTVIAEYLQYLRKLHHYTQEELADRLDLSRQAVSKWETGAALPDIEVWLKLSKLYDMTINDLLEPKIYPQKITDFEQLPALPADDVKEALQSFDTDSLVTALMGASPETNRFVERLFPDIDYEITRNKIGRVRIETVADMQDQILSMINLRAADEAL